MKPLRPSNLPLCVLAQLGLMLVLAYMFVAQAEIPLFQKHTPEMAALLDEGQTIVADVQVILDLNAARAGEKDPAAMQSALAEMCSSSLTFLGEWSVQCSADGDQGVVVTASHPELEEPISEMWTAE